MSAEFPADLVRRLSNEHRLEALHRAERDFALDLSRWRVKPIEIPFQKRRRLALERKLHRSRTVESRDAWVIAVVV